MRPYGRPQLGPDRRWYVAAYRRALWRTLGVITLTFVCYRLLPLRWRVWLEVRASLGHPERLLLGEGDPMIRSLMEYAYPFSIRSPLVSSYQEYVGNVLSTDVGLALLLAGFLAVAVHVSER